MPEPESELAREGCGQTSVCRQVVAGLHPGRSKVCSVALSAGSVLDKAQHLRPEVLEDLRLLACFAMDSAPRLGLLLAGLTEWQRRLARAVPTVLNQRIVVCQPRAGLARAELGKSVQRRLRLAGCEWPLLEPAALEALLLACAFSRSACLRLDRWEAPAGKKGSGPGKARHRRLQVCLRSEPGIAVPLRVPVGQRI